MTWIAAKIGAGSAPKSIINYLAHLQAIFTPAVKRGWCTDNPVARVDKPRKPRDREAPQGVQRRPLKWNRSATLT